MDGPDPQTPSSLRSVKTISDDFISREHFLTSRGRFVDRWQAMELAYLSGQVDYDRAKKKDYEGEYVDTADFQKQIPHNRHITKDYNGYNMLYSEDLY